MDTNEKIKVLITKNKVCLFMKGIPDAPQCGFSSAVVNVLKHLNVKFESVNVLENEKLRSTPVPKYFGTDLGKAISEDVKDPNNVFAGFSSLYLNKSEIEKKIEEYQNKS